MWGPWRYISYLDAHGWLIASRRTLWWCCGGVIAYPCVPNEEILASLQSLIDFSSVSLSVTPFLPCTYMDLHETYTRHWSYEMLVARMISGEKVKAQGHRIHSKFFPCPHFSSVPIWPIYFYLAKIKSISWRSFPGQKVKVTPVIWKESQSDFLPCSPHDSILIWLNHFICGIHTTHEVTRSRAPFSRSKVKGRSNFLPCPLCTVNPKTFLPMLRRQPLRLCRQCSRGES